MADKTQLAKLLRSVQEWNEWRDNNRKIKVDLSNADLNGAKLIVANLSHANLWEADLINTNLSYANLHQANLSRAILNNANLSGANLIKANFSRANLDESILNDANLIEANFIEANLSRIQAHRTNFKGANLTGACIQDWMINPQTNLDNIVCKYIYLKLLLPNLLWNYTDRRPHDPNRNFDPGEFSQLFQIVQDSLSLYFSNGVDWQAAAYSFQSIMTDGTPLDIEGINRTEDGGVIITVNVPENIHKGKVEGEFLKGYEMAQKAFEGERRATEKHLESQERQINQLMTKLDEFRTINITAQKIHRLEAMTEKDVTVSENKIYGSGYTEGNTTVNVNQPQDLASAAKEIQDLLDRLSVTYPTTTLSEKSAVAEKAIAQIKSDENWLGKVLRVIKVMGKEAFFEAIDHPTANVLRAGFEELLSD